MSNSPEVELSSMLPFTSPSTSSEERPLLKKVTYTSDMAFLNEYVYSSDPVRCRATVANPRLTEEHCRYILPKLNDFTMLRALLVEHESFPRDLLDSLALTEEEPLVRGMIAFHPNATDNAKSIVALKGTMGFEDWIGLSSLRRK